MYKCTLRIRLENDFLHNEKENKTYRVQVYTQNVHKQKGSPIMDENSITIELEEILLSYEVDIDEDYLQDYCL